MTEGSNVEHLVDDFQQILNWTRDPAYLEPWDDIKSRRKEERYQGGDRWLKHLLLQFFQSDSRAARLLIVGNLGGIVSIMEKDLRERFVLTNEDISAAENCRPPRSVSGEIFEFWQERTFEARLETRIAELNLDGKN